MDFLLHSLHLMQDESAYLQKISFLTEEKATTPRRNAHVLSTAPSIVFSPVHKETEMHYIVSHAGDTLLVPSNDTEEGEEGSSSPQSPSSLGSPSSDTFSNLPESLNAQTPSELVVEPFSLGTMELGTYRESNSTPQQESSTPRSSPESSHSYDFKEQHEYSSIIQQLRDSEEPTYTPLPQVEREMEEHFKYEIEAQDALHGLPSWWFVYQPVPTIISPPKVSKLTKKVLILNLESFINTDPSASSMSSIFTNSNSMCESGSVARTVLISPTHPSHLSHISCTPPNMKTITNILEDPPVFDPRPFFTYFLAVVSQFYEVIVFSGRENDQTLGILRAICNNGAFIDQILCRGHCSLLGDKTVKELRVLGNRDREEIVILDHALSMWPFDADRLMPIPPYIPNISIGSSPPHSNRPQHDLIQYAEWLETLALSPNPHSILVQVRNMVLAQYINYMETDSSS